MFLSGFIYAQEPAQRWENEVQAYEKQDIQNPPEEGMILFTGSSSIRMWHDIADYFPEAEVLNRGFGGSQFSDLIYYADRLIYPYKPSKIFIYEGDNDIAAGKSNDEILADAAQLRNMIAKALPGVPVIFISPKPSLTPRRKHLRSQYEALNERLRKYAERTPRTEFGDVWTEMLDDDGKVFDHIFLSDSLHMKPEGYKIWQEVLSPFVYSDPS